MIIHTVQSGETVFSIAEKYTVSERLLVINNGLETVTNTLPVGLSIVILFPEITYTVKDGDSAQSIAKRFGISIDELYRNNIILGGNTTIYPGQTLVIKYEDEPERYDISVGGYYYVSANERIINETMPFMKLFMPFTYGFSETGEISDLNDGLLLTRAYMYDSAPFFHISTLTDDGTFSSELAGTLLSNSDIWPIFCDNVISIMLAKGYAGADIDFEFLDKKYKSIYPEFLGYFKSRLNEYSFKLIVAVPPKTSSDQQGALYEGVDYKAIGQNCDYVLLMTYEWGYTFGPPLPVSPTPSIRKVLDYAITQIDRNRIYMGISNYGYDWTLPYVRGISRATSLSNIEAVELASLNKAEIFYDTEYEAPYFNYTDDRNNIHEVWFEDARSLKAKLDVINEYGFFGGLYWNMNRENPQNLALLSALVMQ